MGRQIVILGVFVADTSFRTDRLPKIGETLLGNSFALGPGGKGSNQAVACARIPDGMDFATAAPLMCAGVTTFNALRNADARPGDGVIGEEHDDTESTTGRNWVVDPIDGAAGASRVDIEVDGAAGRSTPYSLSLAPIAPFSRAIWMSSSSSQLDTWRPLSKP